jgi:FkbM family methyltransferase
MKRNNSMRSIRETEQVATPAESSQRSVAASLDTCEARSDDNVIVIASHVSGLKFLENLLTSFGDYRKYPIFLVINEYKAELEPLFQEVLAKFKHLPITVGRLESNSFEFGGLLCAYNETAYENFFLIPHSCEIVDAKVFEIAFEEYRGRSAAFFLRKQFNVPGCWESHIGKYRREVLTAIDFKKYQPYNIYEATHLSEFPFTRAYQMEEPTAFAFYTLSGQSGEVTEKFGRARLKMTTPYLIKWKTHWSTLMLLRNFPEGQTPVLIKCMMSYGIGQVRSALVRAKYYVKEGLLAFRCGAPWSSRFFNWRKALKKDPGLVSGVEMIRRTRYNPELIRFCEHSERCLHEHDLDSDSLVLDIGAFDGEYADRLFHRYHCKIQCYEPMPNHFRLLAQRFKLEPDVQLHQVGLSNRTYQTSMGLDGLGASEFGGSARRLQVQMQDVAEVFATIAGDVDLLKINIEGGEYPLLERMLEKDLLRRCKKVMIQFHEVEVSEIPVSKLRQDIVAQIEKTHEPIFSFPFMWEGWQRRGSTSK